VAGAVSPQNLSALEDSGISNAATIHSKESLTYTIETTDRPVNCFANQIVIEESLRPATKKYVLFQNKMRHIIPSLLHLLSLLHFLRDVMKPEVVNAIYSPRQSLDSKSLVIGVNDKSEELEKAVTEHNRAHRAAQENVKQILLI